LTNYTNDVYGMLLKIADLSGAADTYSHDKYGQIVRIADAVGAPAGAPYTGDIYGQWRRIADGVGAAAGAPYTGDLYGQILRAADGLYGAGGGHYSGDIYGQLSRIALLGGVGKAPYLGPVATRNVIPTVITANDTQATSRTRHQAKIRITSIQVAVPNFVVSNTTFSEVGIGGPATAYVSVEQLSGTVTRLPWSGAQFGTIANNTIGFTDLTSVNIAAGEYFWVNIFYQNPVAIWYTLSPMDGANGEGFVANVSGAVDTTMQTGLRSGMSASQVPGSDFTFGPIAVLGQTTQPTVALLGDSRVQASHDTFDGTTCDIGEIARSIGASLAYINLGVASDTLSAFLSGVHTNRLALINYCTGAQCNYGINDFDLSGRTSAQLISDISSLRTLLGTKQLGYDTVSPHSNAGNTAPNNSTTETNRIAFNTALRAGSVSGVSFYSETANAIENVQDGGLWKAGYSTDFLHATQAGCLAIKTSGAINPALFHR
jgi:hypothetical protein